MVIEKSNLLALAIGRRKEATAIVQIYPIGANEKSEILINNCLAEVFLQFNAAYLNTLNRSLALLNLQFSISCFQGIKIFMVFIFVANVQ